MKAICVVLAAVLLVASVADGAVPNCGTVVSYLSSCLLFVTNRGPLGGCCGGVKGLYNAARSAPDRQTVCNCLKRLTGSYAGINFAKVAGLPRTCGVNIPYSISPGIDCSKVR